MSFLVAITFALTLSVQFNDTSKLICDFYLACENSKSLIDWNCTNGQATTNYCLWMGLTCDDTGLTTVSLSKMALVGTISSSLGFIRSIMFLDLSENSFYGSIPSSIGQLVCLEKLDFGFNSLTSSIPIELGTLKSLESLYLRYNKLSGSIPASLGNLSFATNIFLDDNKFTGSIPSSFLIEGSLGFLNLKSNQLTGTIPRLTGLAGLIVSFNSLTGSVPYSLCGQLQNIDISANPLSCYAPCLTTVRSRSLGSLQPCLTTAAPTVGKVSCCHGKWVRIFSCLQCRRLCSSVIPLCVPWRLS